MHQMMERQELIDYFMLNYECMWWADDAVVFALNHGNEVIFLEDEVLLDEAYHEMQHCHPYPVTVASIMDRLGHTPVDIRN